MKKILFILISIAVMTGVQAQENAKIPLISFSPKLSGTLNKFSVHVTASTQNFSTKDLSNLSLKDFRSVNLGELTIAYKVNDRLSYGISHMDVLSNPNSGFYNAENQFTSFCSDDDDSGDGPNDMDDINDPMEPDDINDTPDNHDQDDCNDEGFGQNIMGTVTFKLSEKLPFFVQAAGGYSFSNKAPAYTAKIGYNQKILAGLGISAGLRLSDVLHRLPAGAISLETPMSFSMEIGLSWNL